MTVVSLMMSFLAVTSSSNPGGDRPRSPDFRRIYRVFDIFTGLCTVTTCPFCEPCTSVRLFGLVRIKEGFFGKWWRSIYLFRDTNHRNALFRMDMTLISTSTRGPQLWRLVFLDPCSPCGGYFRVNIRVVKVGGQDVYALTPRAHDLTTGPDIFPLN